MPACCRPFRLSLTLSAAVTAVVMCLGIGAEAVAAHAPAPTRVSHTMGGTLRDDLVLPSARMAGVTLSPNQAPAAARGPGVREGIDVSHWQGRIHWDDVGSTTLDFAVAKATEGVWYVDPWYDRNATRARLNGLRFAAYHYANPSWGKRDALDEANFFVAHANLQDKDLLPALDLEESGPLGPDALRKWTLQWLHRVEVLTGVKPMVYTSPSFWHTRMENTAAIARAGYKTLWVGHWDTRRPSVPAHRWAGQGWTIWQWTDCGHVSGIRGCVDRDALSGIRLKDLTIGRLRQQADDPPQP